MIRGFGFENEPEGGLIIIDQIEYTAEVDQPQNCVPKDGLDYSEIVPFENEASVDVDETIISGDTGELKLISRVNMQIVYRGNFKCSKSDI